MKLPWHMGFRISYALVIYIAYIALFLLIFPHMGSPTAAFSVIPMIAMGWLFGVPGGLIGGVLGFVVNSTLFRVVGSVADAALGVNAVASLAVTSVGVAVGWIGTLSRKVKSQADALIANQLQLEAEIDRRIQVEELLRRDALYDALTDLPNRRLFLDRLTQAMARNVRNPAVPNALLYIDLDNLKLVNDSAGHAAGDALLSATGTRLGASIRAVDTAGRLGGDEFAVILEAVPNTEVLGAIIQRLLDTLSAPVAFEGQCVLSSASVGVVVDFTRYNKVSDIVRDADCAMYHAKIQGGNRWLIHEPRMSRLRELKKNVSAS